MQSMIWYTLTNLLNSKENKNVVFWAMCLKKEVVLTTLLPNINRLVQNFIRYRTAEHLWILHWFLKESIIMKCHCLQFHSCLKHVKTKNQWKYIGSVTHNCNIWLNHNLEVLPMQTVSISTFFISSNSKRKMYM